MHSWLTSWVTVVRLQGDYNTWRMPECWKTLLSQTLHICSSLYEMRGTFCLHTPLSHEKSFEFQDSPTLNAFGHCKLGSRLLCTSKGCFPSTQNILPHYRSHTVIWYIYIYTYLRYIYIYVYWGYLNIYIHILFVLTLDGCIENSCTVGCTLGKQNKFTLKIGLDWRIQNWGPCSCS